MINNKLYIMIGIPASGKTTYAKTHFKKTTYISRDIVRLNLLNDYDSYFSKEHEVFTTFISKIQTALNNHENVIADATHLSKGSRLKLFSHLDIDKEKTEVIAVVLNTPLDICLERNETRTGREYVPPKIIKEMKASLRIPNFTEYNGIFDRIYLIEENKTIAMFKGSDFNK